MDRVKIYSKLIFTITMENKCLIFIMALGNIHRDCRIFRSIRCVRQPGPKSPSCKKGRSILDL